MTNFDIEFLDHVAIRAKDIERSAKWYEEVLGLKRHDFPEWGEFPIFMLAGKTGIAIFPANSNHSPHDPLSKNVKIDHFAFRVSNENFEKAKLRYKELKIKYYLQDHIYFHSIYTKDPDGHTVELTTVVIFKK